MTKSMGLWVMASALLFAACSADSSDACIGEDDDGSGNCLADSALESQSEALLFRPRRFSVSATVQPANAGTVVLSSRALGARCDQTHCDVWLGSSVSLEATANQDFIFLGWSGCSERTESALRLRFVHEDQACVARFAPSYVHVTLGVIGMYRGRGEMSAPDNTSCNGQVCTVPYGMPVTLRPPTTESYRFLSWGECSDSRDPVLVLPTDSGSRNISCLVIMQAITNPVSWSVASGGGGLVRLAGSGPDIICGASSCAVVLGAGIGLEAVPDEGYRFVGWSGCSVATDTLIRMDNVREARSCEAHFEPAP